jgi:hypothetical protein
MEAFALTLVVSFAVILLYVAGEALVIHDRYTAWNAERIPMTWRRSNVIRIYDRKGNTKLTLNRNGYAFVDDTMETFLVELLEDGRVDCPLIAYWEPVFQSPGTCEWAKEILSRETQTA